MQVDNPILVHIFLNKDGVKDNLLEQKEPIIEEILETLARGDRVLVEYYNEYVVIHKFKFVEF